MTATPKWVSKIVTEISFKHARGWEPGVHWRKSDHKVWSSGHCYYGSHIVVTAGGAYKGLTAREEQKIVLLHEMAHWSTYYEWGRKDQGHNQVFHTKLLELLREYNVPIRKAFIRETGGLKKAWRASLKK